MHKQRLDRKSRPGEKSGDVGVLELEELFQNPRFPVSAVRLPLLFADLEGNVEIPLSGIGHEHLAEAAFPGESKQRVLCAIVELNRRWQPARCTS